MTDLRVRSGGDADAGGPLLLLLHGLGGTSDVWRPLEEVLAAAWPGRWVAPDLPGHGGSGPLPRYAVGTLAAALVGAVPAGTPVAVLGHSLGGALGLALASGWFGVDVTGVAAVGVKTSWTDEDLERGRALAARPHRPLPDRAAALDRHLRLAGLAGLVGPGAPAAGADVAVARAEDGWRPALDPAAFGVSLAGGTADALVRAARCPVLLARGEHDGMASDADHAALGAPTAVLPGLGHVAHVEDPAATWAGVRAVLDA